MATQYNLGDSIYYHFTIYTIDGITPLTGQVQANFTFTLLRDSARIAIPPLSIGECGTSGTYYAIIIPTQTGQYQFRVRGLNDSLDAWHVFDFDVVGTNSGLYIIERILKNRLTISEVSGTYYQNVYDDTGTNIILSWRLYDKDNLDVVLTGRGPASRSIPSGA